MLTGNFFWLTVKYKLEFFKHRFFPSTPSIWTSAFFFITESLFLDLCHIFWGFLFFLIKNCDASILESFHGNYFFTMIKLFYSC